MVEVRHRDDGPSRFHNGGGIRSKPGDVHDVNAEAAEALVSTGYFEYVADDTGGEDDVDTAAAGGHSADAPEVDEEHTCSGKGGECSRAVDEPGGYCWQHED